MNLTKKYFSLVGMNYSYACSSLSFSVFRFCWKSLFWLIHIFLFLCFSKHEVLLKDLLQCLHKKGFSPVWILSWTMRLVLCLNLSVQNLHPNGFLYEWIPSCLFKHLDELKLLPQSLHEKGFSLVWMILWAVRAQIVLNFFRQYWHE